MADLTASPSPRVGYPAAWQLFFGLRLRFLPYAVARRAGRCRGAASELHTQGIELRLRSTLLRCQPFQNSRLAFLTPFRQMRRVQTVSPKHSANLARLSCRICFRQNFLLVLCRVLASFGSS